MSGGHWEYSHYRIREYLADIGLDGNVICRMPKLAQVFRDLANLCEETVNDLDYDLSGDSEIESDKKFEMKFLKKMNEIINKKRKFVVYESVEE